MQAPQSLVDLVNRNAVALERLKAGESRKFQAYLREIDKSLRERLLANDLTEFSRARMERLLVGVAGMLGENLQAYASDLSDSLVQLANQQGEHEAGMITAISAAPDALEFVIPSVEQMKAAVFSNPLSVRGPDGGKLLQPFIDDWTTSEIDTITGAIRQGYFEGQTTQQIVQRIRGTKANNYADGLLARTNLNADAITRTAINHAATTARVETMKANSDICKGYRFHATLDSKTSTQCFVGSTLVAWDGPLQKIFRSEYVGNVITVTTAAGKKLEGTPNHPVLTPNGFLPLHELKPGQEVVCSVPGKNTSICSYQKIAMPATLSELFDFFSHQPSTDILRKRASADDFYGDGAGMDGEINTVLVESELGYNLVPVGLQDVQDNQFSLDNRLASVLANGAGHDLAVARAPIIKPSQITPGVIESGIEPASASPYLSDDFNGPFSGFEHFNDATAIINDKLINLPPAETGHGPGLFEKRGDCGGGYTVLPANTGGAAPLAIETDYIIGVISEFRRCHVYTLECSQGFYSAGGLIVKNCRSLDGQVFKFGKGPLPPLHIRCRSTVVEELSDEYSWLSEGATRSSAQGYQDAQLSYYDWLKTQTADYQDEVLGPTRGKLLRDGGLSSEKFSALQLDRNFMPITLDEMKKRNPLAFKRAGI